MKKKVMLVGLITILSVGIITSYKQEDKAKEVEYDSNTMAVYIKDNNGIYQKESSFPTSGYKLNTEKSVCTNGVTPVWSDNSLKLNDLTNTTSCYLYFDEMVAKDTILANKVIDTSRSGSITGVLKSNTTGKIYTAEDDDGTSYYYAGSVDNNWVKFGGFYWRIIRINGDGTLRLIYNGTTTAQTGSSTRINEKYYKFSHKDAYYEASNRHLYTRDNAYVGYMYGTAASSTYAATHQNINNSYAKQVVDEWYNTNLNKDGIKEHIDTNAGFCGDRTSTITEGGAPNGSGGYGTTATYYGPYYRLNLYKTPQNPSLKCTNSNDLYTTSSSNKGNKVLTYPVGLITADEVAYAGGRYYESDGSSNNTAYYLYSQITYWTMSPAYFNGGIVPVFAVHSDGTLISRQVHDESTALRPVINLKSDVKLTGDGTTSTPYEVVG